MTWALAYFLFFKEPVHASSSHGIDEYYSALTKMHQFSGAVLHYKNGQKEFSKLYGQFDRRKKQPHFRIGSLSKPITSTAVLSLVEKKKLELDTSVNRVLTDLNIPDSVTLRNLLNHTSGAVYELNSDVKTEKDFRRAVKDMPWGKPGTSTYSNVGYQLLALVVSAVSGQAFDSYIETEVFAKLTASPVKKRAQGLNNDCGKTSVIKHQSGYDVGSGGIIASPDVISEFFIALNENQILSAPLKKAMFEDPNQLGYGLGINVKNVEGQKIYGHNGSIPGFKSFVMFNEKKEYLFVFSNLEQFPLIQAQKDATLLLTGKDFQIPVSVNRKVATLDTKTVMDFVGNYVLDFDANQKIEISYNSKDDHFYMLDTGKKLKLLPESANSFFTCPTSTDTIAFKREGKKTRLEFTIYGGAKVTASRY